MVNKTIEVMLLCKPFGLWDLIHRALSQAAPQAPSREDLPDLSGFPGICKTPCGVK